MNTSTRPTIKMLLLVLAIGLLTGAAILDKAIKADERTKDLVGGEMPKPTTTKPTTQPMLKIFSGEPRLIVVNGYSTSFHWPAILQRKLDRYFSSKRIVEVKRATKGGTPIAKWMDVTTGKPLNPWLKKLRPVIQANDGRPVIVLAQQSLQWAFGHQRAGINSEKDTELIRQGADILEKYVRLLRKDGADLVFVAMHIYKKPMEPQIGNERLAIAALIKRKVPGFLHGPDVWTPTKELYPKAFAADLMHPNQKIGAEVMAQHWFETLMRHDGLEVTHLEPGRDPAGHPG